MVLLGQRGSERCSVQDEGAVDADGQLLSSSDAG